MGILTNQDVGMVNAVLGNRNEVLGVTVARLYLADPDPRQWTYSNHMGVIVLAKDRDRKSYFIRLVSLQLEKLVWEQELYSEMQYKTPKLFFHTFATDKHMAGLSFADETEAESFGRMIKEYVHKQANASIHGRNTSSVSAARVVSPVVQAAPVVAVQSPAPVKTEAAANSGGRGGGWFGGMKKEKPTKKKKGKLSLKDISGPSGFEHKTHIGFDKEKGLDFDPEAIPPEWLDLFTKAGVTKEQLQNPEDRKFIFDFVQQNQNSLRSNPPPPPQGLHATPTPPAPTGPPPSSRGAPPPPPSTRRPRNEPPRPPPSRTSTSSSISSPPINHMPSTRGAPPPPPQSRSAPPPPPASSNRVSQSAPVPQFSAPPPPAAMKVSRAPSISTPPPPPPTASPPIASPPPPMSSTHPPPPPASSLPPPPPPPPPPMDLAPPAAPSTKQTLPPPPAPSTSNGPPRPPMEPLSNNKPTPPVGGGAPVDLLAAIRAGNTLKKVEIQEEEEKEENLEGLAGALSRALQNRNKAMNSDEED